MSLEAKIKTLSFLRFVYIQISIQDSIVLDELHKRDFIVDVLRLYNEIFSEIENEKKN